MAQGGHPSFRHLPGARGNVAAAGGGGYGRPAAAPGGRRGGLMQQQQHMHPGAYGPGADGGLLEDFARVCLTVESDAAAESVAAAGQMIE